MFWHRLEKNKRTLRWKPRKDWLEFLVSCCFAKKKKKKKKPTKHSQNKHCGNKDSCHWQFKHLLYPCCRLSLSNCVFSRLTPTFDDEEQTEEVKQVKRILTCKSVLTWLHHPRLGPQVGQVDVGLPAVDDWVGVLAGSVRGRAVRHRHLAAQGEDTQGMRWNVDSWNGSRSNNHVLAEGTRLWVAVVWGVGSVSACQSPSCVSLLVWPSLAASFGPHADVLRLWTRTWLHYLFQLYHSPQPSPLFSYSHRISRKTEFWKENKDKGGDVTPLRQ